MSNVPPKAALVLLAAGICFWQAARDPPAGVDDPDGIRPELRVEQLGPTFIEQANNFSENTRIKVSLRYPAGHPRAGRPLIGDDRQILVEEWVTEVYDGRYGATALPVRLRTQNGEAKLVLKSLARYSHRDRRNAPVPRIRVSDGSRHVFLAVPQWIDADSNGMTDWLEQRVESIVNQARASRTAEIVEVLDTLQGWQESFKMDCGGVEAESPAVIRVSTVCLDDDLLNRHRLNSYQELTATILHEAWHVWDIRKHDTGRRSREYPQAGYGRCIPHTAENAETLHRFSCPQGYAYDALYLNDSEEQAEAFASRYRHLFH